MNCDQIFVILTSGPFPTGGPQDALVERHLQGCIDCGRFAEALRPANDIFQEAVPPAEARDLPGYWGPHQPTGVSAPSVPEPSVVMEQFARSARYGTRQPAPHPMRGRAVSRRAETTPLATVYYREQPQSTWGDVVQVAGFLMLITAAACGLGWLFG